MLCNCLKNTRGVNMVKYITINGFQTRSSASPKCSSESDLSYNKLLLKKFILQIHPDFFHNNKSIQTINETNLKALQNLDVFHMKDKAVSPNVSKTRTLTFYVKPSTNEDLERRVKVSVYRVEESLREVLETLGVELPPRPQYVEGTGVAAKTQMSYVSADSKQIEAFLETLIDRKDLMKWRLDAKNSLENLKLILQNIIGVDSISIRVSWSAQNNRMLINNLLRLVQDPELNLYLPWTNMSLVITADDCSNLPVDSIERHILINPCQVPMQWIAVFQAVSKNAIDMATANYHKLNVLKVNYESIITSYVQSVMIPEAISAGKGMSEHEIQRRLKGIKVDVRCGHTCSQLFFAKHMQAIVAESFDNYSYVKKPNNGSDVNNNTPDNFEDIIHLSDSKEIALSTSWLDMLPLTLTVIIEEGHGSRLTSKGDIRIECRSTATQTLQLLKSNSHKAIELVAEIKILLHNIELLKTILINRLNIISIDNGIGVNLSMIYQCLCRLNDYTTVNPYFGKFRHLSGLRVIIGKYLGLSDDGAVILPHDWNLDDEINIE